MQPATTSWRYGVGIGAVFTLAVTIVGLDQTTDPLEVGRAKPAVAERIGAGALPDRK